MAAVKNGREYLAHVTETLRHRITQLDDSIEAGQKEIEGMHEYYWENYTEMDSRERIREATVGLTFFWPTICRV